MSLLINNLYCCADDLPRGGDSRELFPRGPGHAQSWPEGLASWVLQVEASRVQQVMPRADRRVWLAEYYR